MLERVYLFWWKQKAKIELRKAFNNAGLYISYKTTNQTIKKFPKIHSVTTSKKQQSLIITFTLLNGMDPKELLKKEYVFKQHFGSNIELDGDYKIFKLVVFANSIKAKLKYKYTDIAPVIAGMKVPIICGKDRIGNWIAYDAKTEPNALISGEPGSGKSTQLRSVITTLIQYNSPNELHLYLGDLKMSEFHLFKGIRHVQSICTFPDELGVMLLHVYSEMLKRSELLNAEGVMHIDDLPKGKRPPYIVLAIDEIVMVMDNKEIKNMLVQIDSLGRALGIYNILSLQRPSHDILDTKVRSLLTVRMGFRTTDLANARIIGTPGSEKISRDYPGRFLLKRDELTEIQSPFLTNNEAVEILKYYKSKEWVNRFSGSEKFNLNQEKLTEEDIFDGGLK